MVPLPGLSASLHCGSLCLPKQRHWSFSSHLILWNVGLPSPYQESIYLPYRNLEGLHGGDFFGQQNVAVVTFLSLQNWSTRSHPSYRTLAHGTQMLHPRNPKSQERQIVGNLVYCSVLPSENCPNQLSNMWLVYLECASQLNLQMILVPAFI